ncbi:MAG: SGNH/GDSL hydrolase family protein [Ruminococcaceae bacterium]|nr:SGNH/GDSL hydrolase family protein [Oscillospiraceae bacterium]
MRKLFKLLLFVSLICFVMAINSFASETVVYLKDGANGDGTHIHPFGKFSEAVDSFNGKGGKIVILESYTLEAKYEVAEQSGNLTLSSENGAKLLLNTTLAFEKNSNNNLITIDCPIFLEKGQAMFGGFNNIIFTENVTIEGALSFYGGVDCAQNSENSTGDLEVNYANNLACITELPYSITVNGGTFAKFFGGNRRSDPKAIVGSIAAPLNITINNGTFGSAVEYSASDALKLDCKLNISGYSILADNATLTINGGTFNSPIYAQGHLGEMCTNASAASQVTKSDKKYYVCDGDISININGGTFNGCEINAFQNASVYTLLLRGNYNLIVSDNATLASGTVLDATQVKAYSDSNNKASLTYPESFDAVVKRFDIVNGAEQSYTEPLRIACIGDSITEGYSSGDRQRLSYPAQLLKKLHDEGKDVILGNYGCSGTRVEDYNGQYYNDMLAYNLALESDADWFIVGLGTNDAGVIQGGREQLDRFYEEYMQLLKDFGELDTTKKVYSTTATHRPSTLGYGAISVRAYQIKAVETLAKTSEKYVLIDLYALTVQDAIDGKFLSGDNLHPHADGYGIYVNVLCNAIYNGVCKLEGFESEDIYIAPVAPEAPEDGVVYGTLNIEATKDNPTNSLMIAFAKAAPTSTLHIIGTYTAETYDQNRVISTPPVNKFTIVGEGEGAALVSNSKYFLAQSDIVLDNFTLTTSSKNSIMIQLGYNNATLTETFTTESTHYPMLSVGYISYPDNRAATYHTTEESASSDKDCVVNVNGGTYSYIHGGNYLYSTAAVYGTYSGNMVLNIGNGVKFTNISNNTTGRYSAACGHNYLTGTITMNVGAWHDGWVIRDYALPGSNGGAVNIEPNKNTGTVTINRGEDVINSLAIMGDFDNDASLTVKDILLMIKYFVNGANENKVNFYGINDISLAHVVRLLKKTV